MKTNRRLLWIATAVAFLLLVIGALSTGEIGQGAAQDAAAPTDSARVERLVQQIKHERKTARVAKNRAYHRGYQRGRRSIVVSTDVQRMIRTVSAHYGVSIDRALYTARCESTYRPGAKNGRFLGVYQLGDSGGDPWYASTGYPLEAAGFTRTDALANILATIAWVDEHGWTRWDCGGFSYR